ncbi:hypothetical protein Tco_0590253 [Tanacetum coccineum]
MGNLFTFRDRVCISIDVVLCYISLFWKLLHTDPREACLAASAVQVTAWKLSGGLKLEKTSNHPSTLIVIFFTCLGSEDLFPDQQDRGHKSTQSYVVVRALVILVYPGLSVHDFKFEDCLKTLVVGLDWLMRDEEIDASGNSDDQRTPIPPMPWIHVNSCKLDPQVSDATAKITSSNDHRIKINRRQYRPNVKNIRHATPIPPAPPLPRASSLAQAPAPCHRRHHHHHHDWINMTDEAMDASGNSDDQRTPTPPPVP